MSPLERIRRAWDGIGKEAELIAWAWPRFRNHRRRPARAALPGEPPARFVDPNWQDVVAYFGNGTDPVGPR